MPEMVRDALDRPVRLSEEMERFIDRVVMACNQDWTPRPGRSRVLPWQLTLPLALRVELATLDALRECGELDEREYRDASGLLMNEIRILRRP
jgi:hypothetical protein